MALENDPKQAETRVDTWKKITLLGDFPDLIAFYLREGSKSQLKFRQKPAVRISLVEESKTRIQGDYRSWNEENNHRKERAAGGELQIISG